MALLIMIPTSDGVICVWEKLESVLSYPRIVSTGTTLCVIAPNKLLTSQILNLLCYTSVRVLVAVAMCNNPQSSACWWLPCCSEP